MQPVNYYCVEYISCSQLHGEAYKCLIIGGVVIAEDSITTDGLLGDTIYVFELIAVNDFGAVSTGNRTICMLSNFCPCSLL